MLDVLPRKDEEKEQGKTPLVSVIIPCYNEVETIPMLLESLLQQSFPQEDFEIIIADGFSTDGTRERIVNFLQYHPDLSLKIVDNPKRTIPAALNTAIRHARGEIIVRLDAHSIPDEDYIEQCVRALRHGLGDNVGGAWEIHPGAQTWQARAIALAASHPLGVGDARYRYAAEPGLVDTVPFGAYFRTTLESLGGFDEGLLTNEDYELNARLRLSGGKIWFDPRIRCVYFARARFIDLARQYWRYGYWKARMLRRHPNTLRWRQALPPLFVMSLDLLAMGSFFFPLARSLFMLELSIYGIILLSTGLVLAIKEHDIKMVFGVPLAMATMHLSWGNAFLWSLLKR